MYRYESRTKCLNDIVVDCLSWNSLYGSILKLPNTKYGFKTFITHNWQIGGMRAKLSIQVQH